MKAVEAAVGFRVRSGWAAVVLMSAPTRSPQVLDSRIVDLSDPDVPESRQPYHAARGTLEENDSEVQRRIKVIRRVTKGSVAELLEDYGQAGYSIHAAGLVVGSKTDPATIKNPHMRAHALEGHLFRTLVEATVRSHGLPTLVIVERDAYSEAAKVLDASPDELRGALSALGRSLSGPWRADQKLAALVAWMAVV